MPLPDRDVLLVFFLIFLLLFLLDGERKEIRGTRKILAKGLRNFDTLQQIKRDQHPFCNSSIMAEEKDKKIVTSSVWKFSRIAQIVLVVAVRVELRQWT